LIRLTIAFVKIGFLKWNFEGLLCKALIRAHFHLPPTLK